jgi:hypothetical protein
LISTFSATPLSRANARTSASVGSGDERRDARRRARGAEDVGAQLAQLGGGEVLDAAAAVRGPVDGRVVDDDGDAVGGELDVELEDRALRERRVVERRHRLLGEGGDASDERARRDAHGSRGWAARCDLHRTTCKRATCEPARRPRCDQPENSAARRARAERRAAAGHWLVPMPRETTRWRPSSTTWPPA